MTNELHISITKAFDYLSNHTEIPVDLMITARIKGIKAGLAAGDLSAVNKQYHDKITSALIAYFEGGGIAASRNQFKQAMINAFGDAFDLGWTDSGGKLPVDDEDALSWLGMRMNQEASFIDMLFQEAKELRKDKEFDFFEWVSERADGYVNTLKEIYNAARLRYMSRTKANMMVTFAGEDGAKSCKTCQRLQGKRRKLSWFIANNYIPPFGGGLDCARGGRCKHGLMDDNGNWVTV